MIQLDGLGVGDGLEFCFLLFPSHSYVIQYNHLRTHPTLPTLTHWM